MILTSTKILSLQQSLTRTVYPNTNKNPFQLSTRISKGFTTGLSKIIAIMFAWNPLVSIGFLFLIISKMTSMSASHIPNMSKSSKAKNSQKDSDWFTDPCKFDLSDILLFFSGTFAN